MYAGIKTQRPPPSTPPVREIVDDFEKEGRLCFLQAELASRLPGTSALAREHALIRLMRSGRVLRTSRGANHWLIVPLSAAKLGAPPLESWLEHYFSQALHLSYVVGLLSAAEYHGAAPYAVMQTHLFTPGARRPMTVGRTQLVFHARKDLRAVPWTWHESADGRIRITTLEVTIVDVVRYMSQCGGLTRVAAVLKNLLPRCSAAKLTESLDIIRDVTATQRLGALCTLLNFPLLADAAATWLQRTTTTLHWRGLSPEQEQANRISRAERFRIWIPDMEDAGT